ncbi:MAG: glycosyltransferase family 4 protein [Phascolarctobacterium sp.]|uniref:glycosyltransferase family 4 protein n=1 Tax=Phascolarctobacterium sp. TaxID=2049039 RepID=UPI0026DA8EFD|nr:glycosyltransferase family 4 protein [Phascolarctobacterium sp.]MDO4921253.1 glycosyltransferase family 4 protein [Phascolarctobacterium sp.]
MKIAIVHEWFDTYAGSEKVLEQILSIYPDADLYAVVDFLPNEKRDFIQMKPVITTFIQHLPKAKKAFRKYLPLMPLAVEQLDVRNYDIVISNTHCVAKGIITGPSQLHISYTHSPMRYAWDLQKQYLQETNLDHGVKGWLAKLILHYLRIWDIRSSNNVDYFICNSHYIAKRIQKCYRRNATVIYPPVAVDDFTLNEQKEDFYLTASRMVPYKKMDLIVEAFSKMPDKKLIVIGDGPDFSKIKAKAGKNVTLMGYQPFEILKEHMQKAKAFVFAAEEDFGIVPVEAQACGTPVIAYGKGGSLETVRGLGKEEPTGIFFQEQTADSLIDAVKLFEEQEALLTPQNCRKHAEKFGIKRFREEFKSFVENKFDGSGG